MDSFTRVCAFLTFALSVVLILFSFLCLFVILCMRRTMLHLWNGETGENVWGFGQVSALFVWVPLFLEIGGSALDFLGDHCGWKRCRSESTGVRVVDEERGMPLG